MQSCRDGTKLRDLDLNRQNCNSLNVDQVQLTNEHGDVFLRHNNEFDDCGPVSGEGYEDFPPNQQQYYNNNRPSPAESDYFYDQYVDFPVNETMASQKINQSSSPIVDFNQNKFTLNQFPPRPPPPTSPFTFFGHPLPSLNLWGSAGRTANNRATSGENTRGKGRVQIFKPDDPELSVIFNRPNSLAGNKLTSDVSAASVKNPVVNLPSDKSDEKLYRPFFQTPFTTPNVLRPVDNNPFSKPYTPPSNPFLQPKPEKGFSPMIPGISVGGFIPIQDPVKNETFKNNDWPKDEEDYEEDLKKVPLVTRPDTATKRTIIRPHEPHYTAQIEKVGTTTTTTTISHLKTSLSPILSTLIPKPELITEKSNFDDIFANTPSNENVNMGEYRNSNKLDKMTFEDEIYRESMATSTAPSIPSSTTIFNDFNENYFQSTASTDASNNTITELNEYNINNNNNNFEDINEFNQTGSSDLSADHLIAPGSIISHENTIKPQISIPKAGKITKVFTVPPPQHIGNSNEISKLISPFYTQFSSEPPVDNFDNEFQPNQIYQQTAVDDNNNKDKSGEKTTAQYDREELQWYFKNYNNQSQSNPILNYNLQPYDNYGYSASSKLKALSLCTLLTFIVMTF
jgi:hypothetical protein